MNIFKKKPVTMATTLIVNYINSILPSGVSCRDDSLSPSDNNKIFIASHPISLEFSFDIEESYKLEELGDLDKAHINEFVIMPALKALDRELFAAHNRIKKRMENLQSS